MQCDNQDENQVKMKEVEHKYMGKGRKEAKILDKSFAFSLCEEGGE